MRIEIVSGSPREASITVRVAKYLHKYFEKNCEEHSIGLIDVREWKLGFLENVFHSIENTPEKYRPLFKRMVEADAFVVVTPEYNGSYSSELKNLFDHFPKQYRKVFGLCTASVGTLGGARCTQPFLLMVPALSAIASPTLLIVPHVDKKFNEQNEMTDASFEKQINTFVTDFLWLAERLVVAK